MGVKPTQFFAEIVRDPSVPLSLKLYRLLTATTALLCLAVVAPVNLLQHFPLALHASNIALGLVAAACYLQSLHGRHHPRGFLVVMLLLMTPSWFWNGGMDGSVTYYFFALLVYPLSVLRGRDRLLFAGFIVAHIAALHVAAHAWPELVVPFRDAADRLIDLTSGVVCAGLAIAVAVVLVNASHDREKERLAASERIARENSARVERTLDALRREKERFSLALTSARQGWFEIDTLEEKVTVSPEYAAMIGRPAKSYDTSLGEWLDSVHPSDRDDTTRRYKAALESDAANEVEFRKRTASGEWLWIRSVGKIVLRDEHGRPRRMVGIHMDITERKRLEERLRQSQRLEAIGTLAGGVAHELNNTLTPLLMAGHELRGRLPFPSDRELVESIEVSVRRAAEIVRELLIFSGTGQGERTEVAPEALLEDVARIVEPQLGTRIRLVRHAELELPSIEVNVQQMRRALLNLCANAIEAMPDGGVLTLGAHVRGGSWENPPSAAPCVLLTVRDTGTGIAPELLERIFNPFFTTKDVGRGMGLGLSTVHGIVRSHDGHITVESEVGRGSTFTLHLPAADVEKSV